jgi:hypothetical protein
MSSITKARPPGSALRARGGRPTLWSVARAMGALSLLAVGAVHLQQYFELYSEVPTIGPLFVLNFVGATIVGLALLAPVERLLGRFGNAALALLALAGIAQAATAFVFLYISERTPLFGFMEPGYDPKAIMAARISEIATVVLLGAFFVARLLLRRAKPPPVAAEAARDAPRPRARSAEGGDRASAAAPRRGRQAT